MLEIINNLEPFIEDCYSEIGVREYSRMMKISPPKVIRESSQMIISANSPTTLTSLGQFHKLSDCFLHGKLKGLAYCGMWVYYLYCPFDINFFLDNQCGLVDDFSHIMPDHLDSDKLIVFNDDLDKSLLPVLDARPCIFREHDSGCQWVLPFDSGFPDARHLRY